MFLEHLKSEEWQLEMKKEQKSISSPKIIKTWISLYLSNISWTALKIQEIDIWAIAYFMAIRYIKAQNLATHRKPYRNKWRSGRHYSLFA